MNAMQKAELRIVALKSALEIAAPQASYGKEADVIALADAYYAWLIKE